MELTAHRDRISPLPSARPPMHACINGNLRTSTNDLVSAGSSSRFKLAIVTRLSAPKVS